MDIEGAYSQIEVTPHDVAEFMALREFYDAWVAYHTDAGRYKKENGETLLALAHEIDRMRNPSLIVRPQ